MVDNYDSFVYNIVQYIGALGFEPVVVRNDAIDVDDALALSCRAIVVSPGPGHPSDAGISCDLITAAAGVVPVLGVCLGHQAIGQVFGARIVAAPELRHGKTSLVEHDARGVFTGLVSPLEVTRYHSLVIDAVSLPTDLIVTASTSDGTIMGVRHRHHQVEGVQFHPESILTQEGLRMVSNFVSAAI